MEKKIYIVKEANDRLHNLPHIHSVEEAKNFKDDVFLFFDNVDFNFRNDNMIKTNGLGEKWDKKLRDLIRVIEIKDALNLRYEKTNILTPLIYTDMVSDIPWHLNTQGILFCRVSKKTIDWIKKEDAANRYGKHEFDKFWLPFCKDINTIKDGDVLCIFNRRVAGWDGSHERPVIELLGAGGHLPTVWDEKNKTFKELGFKENFQKEFGEELGGHIDEKEITIFGGYQNDTTHELVVLCGLEIKEEHLIQMQEHAYKNIDEDTAGIYLGTFKETIEYYQKNPTPFAGGQKAAPYNFPNRKELMERAIAYSQLCSNNPHKNGQDKSH